MSGVPVYLETFGCQMNELDSELVRGQLMRLGYAFVDDPDQAQVVLFNTCSVREHAESKAYSRIGIVGKRKAQGEQVLLGVLGCMAERDGLDMLRRYPQVDVLCGPGELDRLPALLDAARRSEAASQVERVALAGNRTRRSAVLSAVQDDLETLDLSRAFDPDAEGRRKHSAQVRITRGCNKFCTYCVVPYTRGAEVHRPPDHVIEECKRLADAGAIEITLLGLQRIHDEVPAIQRLRFVTSYPRDFGRDILEVMRDCPRICRYLHAPAQSGSDRILGLMNRGYTRAEYEAFVQGVFEVLPDATLAGDIIVGFPGETDADFEATCDLVRTLPFKNNFIFKYSPRPGTIAIDRFTDDVPDEVKRLRNNQLLALQTHTSERVHAAWVGRTVPVLLEECYAPSTAPSRTAGGVELRWESREAAPARKALRGRTPGDLIVAMDAPAGTAPESLIGHIVHAHITNASALLLHGDRV
ncbi:MAG: radical SAM protein, partial [Planctomycetaceae bacterium]|nr:radical SAM protein [Planctomycetaceae bacterium]